MVEAGDSAVLALPPLHSEFKASSALPEIPTQSSFISLKLMKIVWVLLTVHYSLSTSLHTVWTVAPLKLQKASFRLTAAVVFIPSERPHN